MARKTGSIGTVTAERVLKAASALFARHGYAAVSMRQIAKEVDLQAGALYNHFETKQSILRALLVSHMEDLLVEIEKQPEIADPREALEAFTRFHIRYHIDRPEEVFIAYMELRNLEPGPYREVIVLRQNYERVLRDILRRGMAASDFNIIDAPVTTMAIISMLTGVNTWFRYGGRLGVDEIENIYVNMVLAVAGVQTSPHPATINEELA